MNLVYFAHSYRKSDANVVEFFGKLMRNEGLIPSLDPPSDHLNSAKPEKHLKTTDGMIVVLTAREGGVSRYIWYEMFLCIRARKPLLVFVEDTLPENLVPARILQRRFSRKGYLQQIREHRHVIQIFKTYLGEQPPPSYQPSLKRRSCLIAGTSNIRHEAAREMIKQVDELNYEPIIVSASKIHLSYDLAFQETIASANLAICFVDSAQQASRYLLGIFHASLTPAILFATNPSYTFYPDIPREYQPRIVVPTDTISFREMIKTEISIFEEEYIDLDDQQEVSRYADLLIREASLTGKYSQDIHGLFVKELVMGGQHINTGGGSYVKGSVDVRGGDFTGRDHTTAPSG
jgi:hypothetical protein